MYFVANKCENDNTCNEGCYGSGVSGANVMVIKQSGMLWEICDFQKNLFLGIYK